MITQEELKKQLWYDPIAGVFIRKVPRHADKKSLGEIISGNSHQNGYVTFHLNCKKYSAHRLAWLYVYGVWPKRFLDHKDRNRRNNSISNLRECTASQNQANKPSRSKLGVKGVYLERGRYKAESRLNGIKRVLGRFDTIEEAKAAYDDYCYSVVGDFHLP